MEPETELRYIVSVFYNTPDPYGQLHLQREDLEKIIAHGAAPAFKELPPELLSEIFSFFLPVSLPPTEDEPVLALPLVCRAWKGLVSESPQLWANISIAFDHNGVDVQRITSIAERWLSRAGTICPVNIKAACVGAYATTAYHNPDFVSSFMKLVLSYAHRLKHADLRFPAAAFRPLLHLPAGSFLCLQTLALRPLLGLNDMPAPETGHAQWHWPADATALEVAPSLREICYEPHLLYAETLDAFVPDVINTTMYGDSDPYLDIIRRATFAPSVRLPWAALTVINFVFSAFTPRMWFSILAECATLEELWLCIQSSRDGEPPTRPIYLTHLKTLVITAFLGGAEELLRHLVAPKLTEISFTGARIAPAAFLAFQSRSQFDLEYMLFCSHITADDCEILFETVPDLKGVVFMLISTEHFPASFWERLRRSEILPNLTKFVLCPTPSQMPYLVDIIEARWEQPEFSTTLLNVRSFHLAAVNEELKRLDKYDSEDFDRRLQSAKWRW
jgi:hypothetical protein